MFVQIAPHVKVFLTGTDSICGEIPTLESFTDKNLVHRRCTHGQSLGDKAIFVRKKIDDGMQYALNRRIRFVKMHQKINQNW